jgi:hypothetical protein
MPLFDGTVQYKESVETRRPARGQAARPRASVRYQQALKAEFVLATVRTEVSCTTRHANRDRAHHPLEATVSIEAAVPIEESESVFP